VSHGTEIAVVSAWPVTADMFSPGSDIVLLNDDERGNAVGRCRIRQKMSSRALRGERLEKSHGLVRSSSGRSTRVMEEIEC